MSWSNIFASNEENVLRKCDITLELYHMYVCVCVFVCVCVCMYVCMDIHNLCTSGEAKQREERQLPPLK